MSYHAGPDIHIKDKSKVILNLINYATKENKKMLKEILWCKS